MRTSSAGVTKGPKVTQGREPDASAGAPGSGTPVTYRPT